MGTLHEDILIDGRFVGGGREQTVHAPFDGGEVGTSAVGGLPELRECLETAYRAYVTWRHRPRRERQALLRRIAALVREREEELVRTLTLEVGKPITWSRGEVTRLALTFDLAADLLSTWGLEALPTDTDPRGDGHRLTVERFPIGVVLAMVPYNWPYNLAAHKIAAALAVGNTVILKPSDKATLSTLSLARLIHDAGCPPGVLNAWNGPPALVREILPDRRVAMLSFTGSAAVGWDLKALVPDRKVSLELGGNATAVIHADADLDWAVRRVVLGGYGYAGQVCIAVQHVLVHKSVYDDVRGRLKQAVEECPTGDPMREETVCGPLISDAASDAVLDVIEEAWGAYGAKLLRGGHRKGRVVTPALLEEVPPEARLAREEVFGPVLTLAPYDDLEEAMERINGSDYGIHAGIFTRDMSVAERAYRTLEVGGVVVNDYPTLRFDNMPYGGVKRSGFGREGVRYTMDDMTEPKALLTRLV